jgi:hypothetical protein
MAKDLLTDPFAAPAEPTPDLIKNGRYWLPPISDPTAKRIGWTRATTLVKTVSDMFLIDRYHQREIMIGLAKREDLYDRVCATDFDDKDALNALALDVHGGGQVGPRLRRQRGGHRLSRRHGAARPGRPARPAAEVGRQDESVSGLYGRARLHVQSTVDRTSGGVRAIPGGGTFDRIGTRAGVHYVDDVKSQKTFYTWWEIAMQLAIYANADAMWDEEQHRYVQMPKVTRTSPTSPGFRSSTPATARTTWTSTPSTSPRAGARSTSSTSSASCARKARSGANAAGRNWVLTRLHNSCLTVFTTPAQSPRRTP